MMFSKNSVRLFWWNERHFMSKPKENYGDLLGKYLVEKLSGKKVVFVDPRKFSFKNFIKPIYLSTGSILTYANSKCIVWGSGIISKNIPVKNAKFLAVRGPQTRTFLLSLGFNVPEVYGDPALLLPDIYNPKVKKKFNYGIIPHYNDYKKVMSIYANQNDVVVIDLMTDDVEYTTRQILECRNIISSSLHGLIVPHAYNIPAVWIQFSNKLFGDGVKFKDYFESIGIEPYQREVSEILHDVENFDELLNIYQSLPDKDTLEYVKDRLIATCPFKE